MGSRPEKRVQSEHRHDQDKPQLQVDAARIIGKLQQQRAELSAQLDIVSCALEESQEREQLMLARIAELEGEKE